MRRKISIVLIMILISLIATQIQAQQLIEVKIKSSPSGSAVYLDDKFIGRTPLIVQIAEGKHNIKLDYAEGYIPIDKNIYVSPRNTSFKFSLRSTLGKKAEIGINILWILTIAALIAGLSGGQ